MQKKAFLLVIILLVLPECVLAQALTSYDLDFKIIKDKVLATYNLTFLESADTILALDLPRDAKTIEVYIDDEKIEPEITEKAHSKLIEIKLTEETKVLKISYITNQFLEKTKKSYFLADLAIPYDSKEMQVRLTLPEGAVLDKPLNAGVAGVSAFPKPTSVETDGIHMIITWKKHELKQGASFSILVIFREKKEFNILLFSLIMALLILTVIFFFYARKKRAEIIKARERKAKIKRKKEKFLLHLLEPERAVISALEKAKGKELWQKQIQLQTDFSKAKLSRVIRNLEARQLIKKTPYGTTNKIKLIWRRG